MSTYCSIWWWTSVHQFCTRSMCVVTSLYSCALFEDVKDWVLKTGALDYVSEVSFERIASLCNLGSL